MTTLTVHPVTHPTKTWNHSTDIFHISAPLHSVRTRLLYHYLVHNSHISVLGLYQLSKSDILRALHDYQWQEITDILLDLDDKGYIVYSPVTVPIVGNTNQMITYHWLFVPYIPKDKNTVNIQSFPALYHKTIDQLAIEHPYLQENGISAFTAFIDYYADEDTDLNPQLQKHTIRLENPVSTSLSQRRVTTQPSTVR